MQHVPVGNAVPAQVAGPVESVDSQRYCVCLTPGRTVSLETKPGFAACL